MKGREHETLKRKNSISYYYHLLVVLPSGWARMQLRAGFDSHSLAGSPRQYMRALRTSRTERKTEALRYRPQRRRQNLWVGADGHSGADEETGQ